MKKLALILVGLLSVTQVMADPVYRPYATCISPNHNTNIEIMENTDSKDMTFPFKLSIERDFHGEKISLPNQNAIEKSIQSKGILEVFHSVGLNPSTAFELVITNQTSTSMVGEYKAFYTDLLGRSVVFCSRHITFGN